MQARGLNPSRRVADAMRLRMRGWPDDAARVTDAIKSSTILERRSSIPVDDAHTIRS
jgi:hypothetical protein